MSYTYARRKQLALARFGGDPAGKVDAYTYYRRVTESVRDDPSFFENTGVESGRDDFEAAKFHYEAFKRSDPNDYSINVDKRGNIFVRYDADGTAHGAKAKLMIDVYGYVENADAWRALYPTGTRYGHLTKGAKRKKSTTSRRKK